MRKDGGIRKKILLIMSQILMPKATAVWLIENTCLTFDQIAKFCGLHVLEVDALADGEAEDLKGFDPIHSGQLTQEEIRRCEKDPQATLQAVPQANEDQLIRKKVRYTPLVKRKDKPNAILWLVKYYPELSDTQICKFLGTTTSMVQSIRNKTHWNYENLEPHSPVALGFCLQSELSDLVQREG